MIQLDDTAAARYAGWFACLADPTRIRLLHAVAVASGELPVGALATQVRISQPTCSHHVRRLAEAGAVRLRREGTTTLVSIDETCRARLPNPLDVVIGVAATRPCRPQEPAGELTVRAMTGRDARDVRRIYREGIATRNATFETEVPAWRVLDRKWLPAQRWVAEVGGRVAGWAVITLASSRDCYRGVGESSIYVGDGFRGRGVGRAMIRRQVGEADRAGLWTLQTAIFPENAASVVLHLGAGFRTVGVRERIARLDGRWRDTVLLERRAATGADGVAPAQTSAEPSR